MWLEKPLRFAKRTRTKMFRIIILGKNNRTCASIIHTILFNSVYDSKKKIVIKNICDVYWSTKHRHQSIEKHSSLESSLVSILLVYSSPLKILV